MKTTEEIRAHLADFLNEILEIDPAEVTMEKSLKDDLNVDSLSLVEMQTFIEDEYGVVVPDDEVKNLKTVGDAVAYVETASV